jgi:dihydroxyacetone kinase-like predicted kinase
MRCGRPHRIRITHLASGEPSLAADAEAPTAAAAPGREVPDPESIGVVAWAAGPGLAQVFSDAGVIPVVGRGGHRASTEEVLEAVRAAGTASVVVLPNDTDTLAVARAAAEAGRREGIRVTVVPTRAQVQGLAAAAVHDPLVSLEQDVALMSAAAGHTRHGAVTVAAREAITMAGRCMPGDVLGVVDGDFALIGDDLTRVAVEVTERLLGGGGELVTLVLGEGCPEGLVDSVQTAVRSAHREVEVHVVDGGQGRYPVLVGVE